jgi:uncharacterized protein
MLAIMSKVLSNKAIIIPCIAWLVSQLIKVLIESIKRKRPAFDRFFGSGGMPSSHASFISCLAMSIGLLEGFDSSDFAIAFSFAFVVMYDASGVRRAAGNQAKALNLLMFKHNDDVKFGEKLKEMLGHSPSEVVVGAILGIVLSILLLKY